MARLLTSATNVDAGSTDYPNGRVRDKDGATAGTTYNEVLHGDIIQFFQKLIIDSGIALNGLPDNVTNGYQLYEALYGTEWAEITTFGGDGVQGSDAAYGKLRYRKDAQYIYLKGSWDNAAAGNGFTLPAGFRPAHETIFTTYKDNVGTKQAYLVQTDGTVTTDSGGTSGLFIIPGVIKLPLTTDS